MCLGIEGHSVCIVGKRARISRPIVRRVVNMEIGVRLEDHAVCLGQAGRHVTRDVRLGLEKLGDLHSAIIAFSPQNRAIGPVEEPDPKPEGVCREVDTASKDKPWRRTCRIRTVIRVDSMTTMSLNLEIWPI